ncbi:unnamed protein product [Lupinus luteus]|uniref:AT-hook motif nuclear-localized protein n=1 Tax=Lupinus luteus TaxID=3873 RepID=A0AAV1YE70_LUPLU
MEGHVTQSSISIQSEPPKTQMLGHEVVYSNNNNNINVKVEDSVIASEQVMKRKRGRPRKYDVKGSVLSPTTFSTHAIGTSPKRGRGRPPTLEDNNIIASTLSGFSLAETAGTSFKPYVMTVNTGEDVVSKILAFSQNDVSMAAVSILSATGVVSSALIRNSQASTHTYRREGWFEILSLSGSYIFVADGDAHCKKGLLSILLAGPDGSVYGGILQGSLIAAGPIQVRILPQNLRHLSTHLLK